MMLIKARITKINMRNENEEGIGDEKGDEAEVREVSRSERVVARVRSPSLVPFTV